MYLNFIKHVYLNLNSIFDSCGYIKMFYLIFLDKEITDLKIELKFIDIFF